MKRQQRRIVSAELESQLSADLRELMSRSEQIGQDFAGSQEGLLQDLVTS